MGGGTQCHIAVHTGYRNLQREPHSALRPHIVEVYTCYALGTFSFCIESQVAEHSFHIHLLQFQSVPIHSRPCRPCGPRRFDTLTLVQK